MDAGWGGGEGGGCGGTAKGTSVKSSILIVMPKKQTGRLYPAERCYCTPSYHVAHGKGCSIFSYKK